MGKVRDPEDLSGKITDGKDLNSVIARNVSHTYAGATEQTLKDVSFEVQPGEFVCILGQSGCGKSTLLRLLAGLETPTQGEIYLGGIKHRGPGLRKAVVFQDYGLFPWMTAGENIILALEQKYPKRTKAEYKERTIALLRKVKLDESVFKKYAKELSGVWYLLVSSVISTK